jgi:hypothetical protein
MLSKTTFVVLLLAAVAHPVVGQATPGRPGKMGQPNSTWSIGVLQGGSLVGVEREFRIEDAFGLQVGAGLVGFSLGANYHFRKTTNRSLLSAVYKNVGLGYFGTAGLEYGYRWAVRDNWGLGFQLGYGLFTHRSTRFDDDLPEARDMPGLLTYSMGIFF